VVHRKIEYDRRSRIIRFMKDVTRDLLDRFFEQHFETAISALSNARVVVRAHPKSFEGYEGAYLLRNPHGYLLCVPPGWLKHVTTAAALIEPEALFDVDRMRALFGDATDVPVGPATIAYADETDFIPAETMGARMLTHDDADALVRMRDACDSLEWDHGGHIHPVQHPTFAVFDGEEIVAAASYDYQGESIRHVGFVTHPAYRGRGYGRAVASAITAHGLAEGGVMQWQTLNDNAPSFHVGRALGYKPWVETIAVRLKR
jgi:GNAT superfamily N-acetyltransferase